MTIVEIRTKTVVCAGRGVATPAACQAPTRITIAGEIVDRTVKQKIGTGVIMQTGEVVFLPSQSSSMAVSDIAARIKNAAWSKTVTEGRPSFP